MNTKQNSDKSKKALRIGSASKRTYNDDEMRHIAVNYAIHCIKGYEGSFYDWFNRISKNWEEIANRKK